MSHWGKERKESNSFPGSYLSISKEEEKWDSGKEGGEKSRERSLIYRLKKPMTEAEN